MQQRPGIARSIANTAVFIILEIAAIAMLSHSREMQGFLISRFFHGVYGYVWGIKDNVQQYFSLKSENERLAIEITDLRREVNRLQQYREAETERETSDSLGLIRENPQHDFLPASVLRNSTNSQHNYLILDKGSEDGVRMQSGVITAGGVIGIIDAVSKHYSYALSLLNSDISISARLNHEGATGPLSWDGTDIGSAVLKGISLQHKFEQGDTVYTSGYSSIFPPDIPIGVTGESKIVNGSTYDVEVRLFQDFSAIRYVTIVHDKTAVGIDSLESAENILRRHEVK